MIRKIGFLVLPLFCCGIDLVNGRKIVVSAASSSPKPEDGIDPDSFQMMLNQFQSENLRYHLHACECSRNNESANAENLDCSKQTSSEWEPPNFLMPEKPGGLKYFILKMHEGNTPFCPLDNFTSIFVSIGGSRNDQHSPKILDEDGTLQIFDDIFGLSPPRKIKKSGYCIIRKKGTIIFNICTQDVPEVVDPSSLKSPSSASSPIANISNYVKKCCNFDQIMDGNNPNNCITVTNKTQWWYPIYYRDGHRLRLHHSHELPNPTIVYGFPTCSSYIIESFRDNKFPNLQENGDVILVDEKAVAPKKKHTPILAGQFCIDGIYIKHLSPNDVHEDEVDMMQRGDKDKANQDEDQIYTYSGSEWHQGIIVCTPEDGNKHAESPSWTFPLYAAVNHTAALFLLLTAAVYILLWSHHNIHGWLQFSYVVSLFFAFSFLAIIQVWSQVFIDHWPRLCYNLGWLIHFSILSSFFWLTAMNFDLWWRFSGRRFMMRIRSKPCRENVKKFVLFALFSVPGPVVITCVAVYVDRVFEEVPDSELLIPMPRFGVHKCYFADQKSSFPFLYFPIGILLFMNLLFFSSTVVQLRKIHSDTELAKSHSTSEDKNGVRLIAKLFIVMGVLWTFEFVSFAAGMIFTGSEELLVWIFMPTEIINSFQGVAIFVIFICKPNVLSQLSAKFGALKCR